MTNQRSRNSRKLVLESLAERTPFAVDVSIVPDETPVVYGSASEMPRSNLFATFDEIYGSEDLAASEKPWVKLIQQAVNDINAVIGETITNLTNDDGAPAGGAPAFPGVRGQVRLVGLALDGNRGKVAETLTYEYLTVIVIDTLDPIYRNLANDSLLLYNVVSHELAHALGADHTDIPGQLLRPVLDTNIRGLQPHDKYSLMKLQGDRSEKSVLELNAGDQAFVGVIANEQDVDTFHHHADRDGLLRIDLTPADVPTIDKAIADLSIRFRQVGGSEWTTWDSTDAGAKEVFFVPVINGQQFEIQIFGSGGQFQPYELTVNYDRFAQIPGYLQPTKNQDSSKVEDNSSALTLRDAIEVANSSDQPTNIALGQGTYLIDYGAISVTGNVVLFGVSPELTVIDAQDLSSIFYVNPTAVFELRNITLRSGNAGRGEDGGAIRNNFGNLILRNVWVVDSSADNGGGVFANGGRVEIDGSHFLNNRAIKGGGAIATNTAELIIKGSLIENNQSEFAGGIYSLGNTLISDTVIKLNSASTIGGGIGHYGGYSITINGGLIERNTSSYGAGIDAGAGNVEIQRTIIRQNTALNAGGGIRKTDIGPLNIRNATIDLNLAARAAGIGHYGVDISQLVNIQLIKNISTDTAGGLETTGRVQIRGSTIAYNTASNWFGGGLVANGPQSIITGTNITVHYNSANNGGSGVVSIDGGTLELLHCTITNNYHSNDSEAGYPGVQVYSTGNASITNCIIAQNGYSNKSDIGGRFSSGGGNVIGSLDSNFNEYVSGDKFGTVANPIDPRLAPISSNGGLTYTRMPFLDSPAVNFAVRSGADRLPDQTDKIRDNPPDSGAVEVITDWAMYGLLSLSDAAIYRPGSRLSEVYESNVPAFQIRVSFVGSDVDDLTLGDTDIWVHGPAGESLRTEFRFKSGTHTAVYNVYAESGTWNPSDGGRFQFFLRDDEVLNRSGTAYRGGLIGTSEIRFAADRSTKVIQLLGPNSVAHGDGLLLKAQLGDLFDDTADVVFAYQPENSLSEFYIENDGERPFPLVICSSEDTCRDTAANTSSAEFDTSRIVPGKYRFFAYVDQPLNAVQRVTASKVIEILPKVDVQDASIRESQLGTVRMQFVFSVQPSTETQILYISTRDLTAVTRTDYVEANRQPLAFLAGETSKTFEVVVLSNSLRNSSKTFTVFAETLAGSQVSRSAVGTIIDDPDAIWGRKITNVEIVGVDSGGTVIEVDTPNPPSFPWWIWPFGASMAPANPNTTGPGSFRINVPTGNDPTVFVINSSEDSTLVVNQRAQDIGNGVRLSETGTVAVVDFGGLLADSLNAKVYYVTFGGVLILDQADGKLILAESGSTVRIRSGSPTILSESGADVPDAFSTRVEKVQVAFESVNSEPISIVDTGFTKLSGNFESEALYADKVPTDHHEDLDILTHNYDVNRDGRISPTDVLQVINYLNSRGRLADQALANFDINLDARVSPVDALLIINYLNRSRPGEGEKLLPDSKYFSLSESLDGILKRRSLT